LTEQGWDVTGKQSSVTSVFMLFKLAIDRRKWESVHVDDMYVDGAQNCPKCGSDLLSVAVSGIVGCEECYQAYRPFIKEMLLSRRDDEIQNSKEDIAQLLNEAIEAEDFEKAAVLRDLLASGEKK
jgi:protein-arginine kinase activator protein McsA